MNFAFLSLFAVLISAQCPELFESYRNGESCLKVFDIPLSFADAVAECKRNGGYIVSIHSAFENQQIKMAGILIDTSVWIGLLVHSIDGSVWEDGSEVNYKNWRIGYPSISAGSDSCASMNTLLGQSCGKWQNDANCTARKPFACQIDPYVASTEQIVSTTTTAYTPIDCNPCDNKVYLTMIFDVSELGLLSLHSGWQRGMAEVLTSAQLDNSGGCPRVIVGGAAQKAIIFQNFSSHYDSVVAEIEKLRGESIGLQGWTHQVAGALHQYRKLDLPKDAINVVVIFTSSIIDDYEEAMKVSNELRENGVNILLIAADEDAKLRYGKIADDDDAAIAEPNLSTVELWYRKRACKAIQFGPAFSGHCTTQRTS